MKSLNEGIFGNIKDIAKDTKNIVGTVSSVFSDDTDDKNKSYLGGSISQYSKNLVMTFPVLCDNTLSPDTASMLSKANERNITTMLMLLFSAMNIEANDGMKVLSQIHKNISTSMDVYEVIDKLNDVSDKAKVFETVNGNFSKESEAITEMVNELKYGKQNRFPVSSFSEKSLDRFTIKKTYSDIYVTEAQTVPDAKLTEISNIVAGKIIQMGGINNLNTEKERVDYINSVEFSNIVKDIVDSLNINPTDGQIERIEKYTREKIAHELQIKIDTLKALDLERNNVVKLVDTDVKKANELQPTVLQVNYSQKKENGDIELRSFLAGVKSRLIAVDSTDIVERLIAKNKTKINFLNFIRATTGEIGFFKDFLFAIDQAKLDSKNAVKKGEAAAIWNCLANRAAKNNNNKLKKLGNDASAITVLVISQETVNYMKSVHKFDLEKMSNTKAICDAYNLMGIIIADDSIEAAKIYYVGNNGYENIAYSFLEKENKNSDYKKMINLMGKMNTR